MIPPRDNAAYALKLEAALVGRSPIEAQRLLVELVLAYRERAHHLRGTISRAHALGRARAQYSETRPVCEDLLAILGSGAPDRVWMVEDQIGLR